MVNDQKKSIANDEKKNLVISASVYIFLIVLSFLIHFCAIVSNLRKLYLFVICWCYLILIYLIILYYLFIVCKYCIFLFAFF